MRKLEDKVILITGAAMGLGLATALECAKEGAKLALIDYNGAGLEQAKEQLIREYADLKIIAITADVSDEQAVKAFVDQTVAEFGTIDGFYNNAGIEGKQAKLADYDMDAFKKVIDINLMGAYYGLRYVIPVMQQQKSGRIVNATSVGGLRGVLNEGPYVASKHAVSGLTKNAALEYAQDGILINAIAPGAILTSMVEEAFKQMNPADPKQAEQDFSQNNPSKRLGKPVEVARLVVFLMSEDCAYVNGQIIAIDGGQSNGY